MIVFLSCRFSRVRWLTCFSRDATATFILPSVMSWLLFYEGKNYDFYLSEAILEFTYNESERGSSWRLGFYFYCNEAYLRLLEIREFSFYFEELAIFFSSYFFYSLIVSSFSFYRELLANYWYFSSRNLCYSVILSRFYFYFFSYVLSS
jgi:hypothetical protein